GRVAGHGDVDRIAHRVAGGVLRHAVIVVVQLELHHVRAGDAGLAVVEARADGGGDVLGVRRQPDVVAVVAVDGDMHVPTVLRPGAGVGRLEGEVGGRVGDVEIGAVDQRALRDGRVVRRVVDLDRGVARGRVAAAVTAAAAVVARARAARGERGEGQR